MKKVLFITALFGIMFMSSCKKDYNKLVVKKWQNTKVEFTNFDQLANFVYQQNLKQIQGQLAMLKAQMKNLPDSTKQLYQLYIDDLENKMQKFNLDTLKTSMKKPFNEILDFQENNILSINSNGKDVKGTWNINNDSIKLIVQNNPFIYGKIKKLSNDEMIIEMSDKADSLEYSITLTFIPVK